MKNWTKHTRDLALSVLVYSVICILLGAPITEQYIQTISLAILLTCFTTLPFIVLDEISVDRINTVYFKPSAPHEQFLAILGYGSLFGSWSSASLLILDWDRPWQAWPYPCLMGTLFGALVGLSIYAALPLIRRLWPDSQCPTWCPSTVREPDCKLRLD